MTRKRKIFSLIAAVIGALIVVRAAASLMSLMAPDEEALRASASGLLRSYDQRNRSAIVQLQNAHADSETIAFVRQRTEQAYSLGEELKRDLKYANPGAIARTKFRQYVQLQCEIERRAAAGLSQTQPWTRAVYSRDSYNKNASRDMQFGCS